MACKSSRRAGHASMHTSVRWQSTTAPEILQLGKSHAWQAVTERLQLQPPTSKLLSAAISAYGSSAQWQLALDTLQQLCLEDLEPNVISFSACMNACEKGSRWEMALDLLSQMPEAQIEPNFISFGTALSALSKGEAWKEALQLLCELPERGIETGMISMNAALSACGRASKWQEATALFFKAHRQTLQPSVVSFSAAISACERGSQWESALCLFEDMQSSEITPNTISFSAVISACEKGGHWALALHFLSLTKDADVICYSAAMSACEKGEQWPSALQLLQQMPLRRCAPNTVSYNAAISACENGSCWEEALQLFESMVLRKLQPNVRTFNALISACPGWQMAAGLFGELRRLVLDPTVVSYNALMGRLETDGSAHWDESLRLLEELQEKAILPDVLTFNTAIAVNRQRKPVVNKLLAAMRSKNLVPDVISYNSAISSCQANSDWHDALQFLDEMYLSSVPVDRISYNAVLSCCFAASQWQKVFQLLDAMVAAGMAGFTASRYDHQSQAGSALDCFKHSVLVALLQRFAQDPAPFTYVDTHAGRGIYELAEDGNFRHGITRLVANNTSSFRCGPLAEFLAVQQKLFQGAPLANRQYMGSACLSLLYLRPHDEAVCFEYASEMKSELVQNFDRMKSDCHGRTRVFQENSYWWLLHHLSDGLTRRGLVFMDPPYEPYDEYMAWNLYVMRHVYHAWPGSCIAVWYPCFTDEQTESFYLQLQHLDVGDVLIADFGLPTQERSLQRSALAILRPPSESREQLLELLTELGQLMGGAAVKVFWLSEWLERNLQS
ncbi:Pentatricopeptide repeat-containing protein At5g02860 [Durusdinium trenchii]|uniref:Pentatricopeptide repeat-containing protein At5g02860 n=1 Tax=Durusdinium trenchii TaxID=1381693 RepID=A0ABP0MD96_9DINO